MFWGAEESRILQDSAFGLARLWRMGEGYSIVGSQCPRTAAHYMPDLASDRR